MWCAQDVHICDSWRAIPRLRNCDVLLSQGVIDSDRKIAAYLDPVPGTVRPGPQLKAHGARSEIHGIGLWGRFFHNAGMIGGDVLQYFDHPLWSHAASHADLDLDGPVLIRKSPVLTLLEMSVPLGRIISEPSAVRMTHARIPMR